MRVIKFSAPWCGPCKSYKMVFDSVVSEYNNIEVLEVDVDIDKDTVSKFNIKSVPTTIIEKNGVELARHSTLLSQKDLRQLIDKYINL